MNNKTSIFCRVQSISRRATFCLCLVLWLLTSLSFAAAENSVQPSGIALTPKTAPDKMLSILNIEAGVVIVGTNIGAYNFGNIHPTEDNDSGNYTISQEFTLINRNKETMIVTAVLTSDPRVTCSLIYTKHQLPTSVPPDDAITVQLVYHLLPLRTGELNESVKILVKGQSHPAAILQLAGTVKDVATFDPPLLDFGTMKPGQIVSKVLKVTYDPHLFQSDMPLPPERLPHVASDLPFVSVKQTAIGFTTRAQLLKLFDDDRKAGPGYSEKVEQFQKLNKQYSRNEEEKRRFYMTLPPIGNIATCLVTVKAPTVPGAFDGFVSLLPLEDTPGTEVIKQVFMRIQGRVNGQD